MKGRRCVIIVGYPIWLNSREDYDYVQKHFPKEQWEPDFQKLLDDSVKWLNVKKLANPADEIIDAKRKVETVEKEDGAREYYQYELKNDPNCRMSRLGLTKKEVENIIQEKPKKVT